MKALRVLVACEFSGTVRRAFAALGHDAWSCDLLPAEDGSNHHITGDARDHLGDGWDLLMVAHPPCTRLCNSGVRWLYSPPKDKTLEEMWADLDAGAALFGVGVSAIVLEVKSRCASRVGEDLYATGVAETAAVEDNLLYLLGKTALGDEFSDLYSRGHIGAG